MKIIIGLGNPGKEYEHTRHNAGFLTVDKIAENFDWRFKDHADLEAEIAEAAINDQKLVLAKPTTFMNNSGRSVIKILNYFKASRDDLIIVHDDADLPIGEIRWKDQGSSAGHRGVQSIIDALGSNAFARARIGVGRSAEGAVPLDEWVLMPWKDMGPLIAKAATDIFEAVE